MAHRKGGKAGGYPVVVALRPRFAGYLAAAWPGGIIVHSDTGGFYDVARRDLGLMLAALTPARLAAAFRSQSTPA